MNSLSTVKNDDWGHPSIHSKLQSHLFYQTIIPLVLLRKFQRRLKKQKNKERDHCHYIFHQYCPMVPFKGLPVIKPIQNPCNKYHNYMSLLSIAVSMQWLGIDFQLNIWLPMKIITPLLAVLWAFWKEKNFPGASLCVSNWLVDYYRFVCFTGSPLHSHILFPSLQGHLLRVIMFVSCCTTVHASLKSKKQER